jgi:hypothetical protein
MDTIGHETLAMLATNSAWPSVSIYLTTHRGSTDTASDRVHLRNLLDSATEQLITGGMRTPDAEDLLAEATALLKDPAFWNGTAEGAAIFVDDDTTRIYIVDTPLPEEVVVGDRFHIRPLALAYHGEEQFVALALDRNDTRLYAGDRSSIHEIPILDAPTSFAESTRFDEREESLQYTTHASPESVAGGGRTIGMFHGHGGENVDKTELARFLSQLEKAVTREIGVSSHIPLLLFGVEYEVSAYRAVNTYHCLADQQVIGATDELSPSQIQARALDALAPHFARALEADLTELREQSGALVSDDPVEIVSAAASGRVKTIFFDEANGPFGRFDRDAFAVNEVCTSEPRYLREAADAEPVSSMCGWDLVDLAVAETVLHGGEVHAFMGEDAPIKGVAAVMRY